jgi:hypothetical protein
MMVVVDGRIEWATCVYISLYINVRYLRYTFEIEDENVHICLYGNDVLDDVLLLLIG